MLKIIDKKRGFSTVGLMAAIVIIICLISIAAVGYTRLRIRANETYAVSMLMKLASAFETYRAMNNTYPPNLAALGTVNPPLIDEKLIATGERQGYKFVIANNAQPTTQTFSIFAQAKEQNITGINIYKIDQSGTLYLAASVSGDAIANPAEGIYEPIGCVGDQCGAY